MPFERRMKPQPTVVKVLSHPMDAIRTLRVPRDLDDQRLLHTVRCTGPRCPRREGDRASRDFDISSREQRRARQRTQTCQIRAVRGGRASACQPAPTTSISAGIRNSKAIRWIGMRRHLGLRGRIARPQRSR